MASCSYRAGIIDRGDHSNNLVMPKLEDFSTYIKIDSNPFAKKAVNYQIHNGDSVGLYYTNQPPRILKGTLARFDDWTDLNDAAYVSFAALTDDLDEFLFTGSFDQDNYLSEFLLDGAAVDMAVDGSTPVEYSYTVPALTHVHLTRGFITIEDGNTDFAPGDFGLIGGALANGVEVSITPNGGAKVVLETWTTNRQIRNTMFDFDTEFKTNGAYVGRWTFAKDLSDGGFSLDVGDKFSFLIQDNLGALDYLSFRLKGSKTTV